MNMATVYKVKRYDIAKDEMVTSARMVTRRGAEIMQCTIIENTGIDIEMSKLEPGQEWTPRGFRPDALHGI
jgi:hypothetical protein